MPTAKETKENASTDSRNKKFVYEYLKCFNGTKAVLNAKFTTNEKSAAVIASKLLRNVKVLELIEKEFEKAGYAVQIALRETIKIATSDIKDFLTVEDGGAVIMKKLDEIPGGMTSCIKEVEENRTIHESADGKESVKIDKIKYKLYDKQKAINDILRIAGKFQDRQEVKHSGEVKNIVELDYTQAKKVYDRLKKNGSK